MNHFRFFFAPLGMLLLMAILQVVCANPKNSSEKALFETLDSTQTRIGFVNHLPDHDKRLNILDYLYYYNGGGVAAGDINNDGLTDLYFVSNEGKNKLYLNKGNFQFEDISAKAGIEGLADWQTGVTMVDVNGDGLLDIYVCAVGNYKGLEGANELYINNGDLTFTEAAADYGLDFTGFSTQAAFFDYDHDGDLDMYLLTHAVHTARSYEYVSARRLKNNEAGDYLFENKGLAVAKGEKKFVDVSQKAGIYQAVMGYGLGIAVADLNNDGWEDLYVSNDFHEDDYYYINNRNGTFTESVKTSFPHMSRYSMGCDIADVNNDGYMDVMTLDMYPYEEKIEKASMGEDPLDIYMYKLEYGYFYQFSRNCLQINMGGNTFADAGMLAGVAATDWSWSPLFADYNNDGIKDLFITNGIVKRPNDMDYLKYIYTDSIKYAMMNDIKTYDEAAIRNMPEGKEHNFIFQGTSSLTFADKSLIWGFDQAGVSNGATYADLDNDGDLDLVTNNINQPASLYRNTLRNAQDTASLKVNNYLRIRLKGDKPNTFGVGAKVTLKNHGHLQVQQLMPTRGFMSSVEPVLTFGLGNHVSVDSVIVVWNNQKAEVHTHVKANQTLVLTQAAAQFPVEEVFPKQTTTALFADVTAEVKLPYTHLENNYYEFSREPLIPFKVSTEGPALATGDINGDGLDDVYAGGAKWLAGKLLIQQANGSFVAAHVPVFAADSVYEDVDAAFFDADGDKDLDLYVVSGGNEFYGKMEPLFDRLYLNDGKGNFDRGVTNLPPMFDNKSCVRPCDFDQDGDMDLFVGGRVVGYAYGAIPNSYLLINDGKAHFSDQTQTRAPHLQKAGMITNAVWTDLDYDKDTDLVVIGDWMSPQLYENQKGKLIQTDLSYVIGDKKGSAYTTMNGFWQGITAADFDNDGDIDLMLGNIGSNTKFRKNGPASVLKMYLKDIDHNQTTEQILAYSRGNEWYTVAFKEELGKQIPSVINKKFTDNQSFAGKTLEQIFTAQELDSAQVREVNKFESVYLQNMGSGKQFMVSDLPMYAQLSKIFTFFTEDLTHDGKLDVLLAGNLYGVATYQGRYDGSYGLLLQHSGWANWKPILPVQSGLLLDGEVRHIGKVKTADGYLYLVARSGKPLQVFKPTVVQPLSSKR